ncbi:MAG: class I tRNA ligase family protein, partial [Sedimentisphaerales bacterium]|nr:class I tRNA ligase family protein [Sedimentisphaerales bacterium]
MGQELSKVYEPKAIENWVSEIWFSGGYFHAEPSADGRGPKPYTIVIPPPNVTAPLHLGHALNNTLQDILIRFHRMRQFNTLWMPGTDHAGIATQTVVEKRLLAEQGKKRTDFERDEFIAHVQAWKDEYEATIISQLKAMGCSCDWQRIRFTMDETCTKAVRAAFFKLFKDGLIYRGKRLVNWDPATQTVLADDEVEHETVQGYFWYLRYPLVEPVKIDRKQIEYVTVATTRPETMLGDTAVAMNPADPRAKYLIGKKVRLPIVGRIIPIIPDEHVVLPEAKNHGQDARDTDEKAKFSTGFLKVTPAHDPDDWEIGQRHNLEVINVLAPDGSISDKHGWTDWEQIKNPDVENLIGMDRFEAREAIVEWFRTENLLEDVREYTHEVGHSYRSHVPIEPYLSDQWYIAVKKPIEYHGLPARESTGKMPVPQSLIEGTDVPVNSLAGLALKPLLDGRLRFIPDRYAKTYQAWLENLRDWPISRQLWWGHQIPIWYCQNCGRTNSGMDDPTSCEKCGCGDLLQDPDVLDTWFSSALWPFSTMGWPDETPELKTFYPG